MSDLQKSLRIRESLLPPASDVIKRLGPGAVAASYIQLLDAAYDTVEDGDKLMARFINTLQDSGYPPLKKSHHKRKEKEGPYFHPKEAFGERWTPLCQQAFDAIIGELTAAPVLGFANPKLPYVLHTDASTTGLGAALYQEQEGRTRVIAFKAEV
ncbi:hypothetical protein AAFF_G00238820 [Aldrovandia affinis]|uniref:Reverse transcriptase/retrotransposon-derived protein RNase H-like domain-containing protein n=1 Tax=Aldrovandia affinis TaxID=143900 RepID=A0AAD7QZS3_9TELE|nr:hypothetical protein AAFF_G00238820 [Aldrovandia affinis]